MTTSPKYCIALSTPHASTTTALPLRLDPNHRRRRRQPVGASIVGGRSPWIHRPLTLSKMASTFLNNVGMVAADGFLDDLPPTSAAVSCGWLSPRISLSRESGDGESTDLSAASRSPEKPSSTAPAGTEGADLASPGRDLVMDFEFLRLVEDPATMQPADELICDGKLVPLQVASAQQRRPSLDTEISVSSFQSDRKHKLRVEVEASRSDPDAVFSPRAPRCSSRWKELLGLKTKAVLDSGTGTTKLGLRIRSSSPSSSSVASLGSPSARSLNRLLHRNRRSCSIDSSMRLPLLQDSDTTVVSASVCSRLSLSSSSSDPDHEDIPRLSLDCEKPSHNSVSLGRNPPGFRFAPNPSSRVDPSPGDFPHRHSALAASGAAGAGLGGRFGSCPMRSVPEDAAAVPARSTSAESPRMNASGKVVFHSLERSSSSPSTCSGGGARVKHRGMERSYSANVVRVSPVLNVPVCSLRGSSRTGSVFGFGQLFSAPQKKDVSAGSSSSSSARNGGVTGRGTRTERL